MNPIRIFPIILTLFLGSFIFTNCFSFDLSEEEARKQFSQKIQAEFLSYKIEGYNIRYVRIDSRKRNSKKALIIFVHGSPGGWGDYISYLKEPRLQKAARLISVDRPGYGGSEKGKELGSLKIQRRLLGPILKSYPKEVPILLVGHSLGGAVIARMAMDYPDLIQALLIVAGSVSPNLEEPAWYNIVGNWPVVRWLLPTDLHTSNREILPLRAELEAMLPFWKKIKGPVSVIHGKADSLVPPGNVDFLRKVLPHENLRCIESEAEGHFILWQNKELILKEILSLIHRIERR